MGRGIKIPWEGGQNTKVGGSKYHGWGINIKWVEGHNTMGMGVKIPSVSGIKIPWVVGSKYH
jgi:hypothetical protein